MCIRSGPVGQVSYRDSGAPYRRRHSYSGISTLRFPLVFVVARCFVSVPSPTMRMFVLVVSLSFFVCRVSFVLGCAVFFVRAFSRFVVIDRAVCVVLSFP